MKKFSLVIIILSSIISCGKKQEKTTKVIPKKVIEKPSKKLFGYDLKDFRVVEKEIKKGETFGTILDKHHVFTPKIYEIANVVKPEFDVRRLRAGKNYTVLTSKDSTEQAKIFIYQHDLINYSIIDFQDSIYTKKIQKPITIQLKKSSGVITSSLSQTLDEKHVSPIVANDLADIYAWTIDFFRLQKNDKFKVIYEQKYIDDTIPAGIGRIKAAYFEHVGKPFYAFNYVPDSITGIEEYFDDEANNLRRAFLKAPLKFSRISSKYNLKRRIAFYGRIKPHLGTDFAAPVGSPIMSTANGKVIESAYRGGNGNYVKVRHNGTYTTQYLHMKKRNVKVGDYVKQGDVIGWVGMTGNTSGPHVCYRFWKNGSQVDPLKQKLPEAEPMKKEIQQKYLIYIASIKEKLDAIPY
ncbi:peptidoglycan DD-metalloendopeptidase family protein [Wenyingzhuangia sp. 2_MG-2023]|uniref:peptidoglycan DD-metalloendopeptidase family protein n=1 Tax=Wenyingzhuangia sp. 2_MG-2023 TaxID=3062639 RepID=UPI0026E2FDEE|nr:peptidoglycan DD-metalloendopeptidase family protein [Wenyingzhuangia sp. 2_MG-2023]MDO6736698.1 peptidoglycan DD-metalloendopeptidase family protein [Wenyingzhuangia sp. 2_MG-2023]MDO6801007.1 peptidoglycan DD-metalloendopeptidase family protein [Wenyingzhuangia sp. 1_MG-2023]